MNSNPAHPILGLLPTYLCTTVMYIFKEWIYTLFTCKYVSRMYVIDGMIKMDFLVMIFRNFLRKIIDYFTLLFS